MARQRYGSVATVFVLNFVWTRGLRAVPGPPRR